MKPIVWLCILLSSYFFCLPLGRFSIFGFDSDFRIFDFAILLFWIFNWNFLQTRIKSILRYRDVATHHIRVLIFVILISLLFNIIFRGASYLGPTLIRTYRFIAYMSTLFAVIAIVDSRRNFRILLVVFFSNVLIQALVAFLQGVNVLDSLWPDYWRRMYDFSDAPVATLSPHHKHIGVVMLMGFCLSIGFIFHFRNLFIKTFFSFSSLLMLSIPFFAGTRTFLLGLAGATLALVWVTKGRSIVIGVFLLLGVLLAPYYLPEDVSELAVDKISYKYEDRVLRNYERGGIERLARERTIIYESVFSALEKYPFLLVTGSGFQAASVFIYGNGAHNNFLQFLVETGVVGLSFFVAFLYVSSKNLLLAAKQNHYSLEADVARFVWIGLIGLISTMFVGETFYAQAAMFTLAGQIMFFLGLGIAPFFWQSIKVNGVPVYR